MMACYTEGGSWIRAGLLVPDTITEVNHAPDLFSPEPASRSRELMLTLDRSSRKSGKGTVRFGSEFQNIGQLLRRQYPSNRFTTSRIELLEVT